MSSPHVNFKIMGIDLFLWRLRVGSFISSRRHNNPRRKSTAISYRKSKPHQYNIFRFLCVLFVCSSCLTFLASTITAYDSNETLAHLSVYSYRPSKTSHTNINVTPEATASKCLYSPNTSHLLLCMDVESNPGPQRISDLPPSTKEFFNKAKRTKLKLVRYESHHTNFTIYATKDLIPKGLLPKCTPAIHSDNPLFWRKWNENLNNLARKQLQLLLEETHNHIKLLTTLLSNQLEDLRTSVNNHSTYTILTTLIENMAFNLSNNLNSLRIKKLKRMPPTDIKNDASNQPAENNPTR